jgi:hypothetical protein
MISIDYKTQQNNRLLAKNLLNKLSIFEMSLPLEIPLKTFRGKDEKGFSKDAPTKPLRGIFSFH